MTLSSVLLAQVPGITHGFGTKGEPIPEELAEAWKATQPRWKQVHGTGVAEVRRAGDDCGEVDALWTRADGVPIAVVTADCVPILLAHREGRAIAAVHAGWRGTRAHILRALWKQLAASGERPSDWVAAIGPSIGPCCYEVSEELAQDFALEFAAAGERVAVPRARILDLPAINAYELKAIGIGEVDVIRACTRCAVSGGQPCFHSYRREKASVRQWSMIIRNCLHRNV